jgi:hypothetical protein
MSVLGYAFGALAGTALLGVILLIVGFMLIGLLAPLGGFVAHERELHAPKVRRVPARAGFRRTALHH